MSRPHVEILYFEGCPSYEHAHDLIRRVADKLGVNPVIRLVEVPDTEDATRLRFLGSPSIRVNGRDVEPGADDRDQFQYACRVYQMEQGLGGLPDERWVRDALAEVPRAG